MDIAPIYKYRNAEIELVIEDDTITTAKIYMDGECVFVDDSLTDEKGKSLNYTKKNRTAVVKKCASFIDKELEEDGREECTDMSLIYR
jgi:hypothetical protein